MILYKCTILISWPIIYILIREYCIADIGYNTVLIWVGTRGSIRSSRGAFSKLFLFPLIFKLLRGKGVMHRIYFGTMHECNSRL